MRLDRVLATFAFIASATVYTAEIDTYEFHRCDNSQVVTLNTLFEHLEIALPLTITEMQKGSASQHGYSAFFKSDTNIPYATSILEKLIYRDRIPLADDTLHRIRLVCVSADDEETKGWYNAWLASHTRQLQQVGFGAGPDRIGLSVEDSADVLLFPTFWALHEQAGEEDCPRVVQRRGRPRAVPNTTQLARNQVGVIVLQLLNKYLLDVPGSLLMEEVFVINECIELRAEEQRSNAMNYAMLVSGECCILPFVVAVWTSR